MTVIAVSYLVYRTVDKANQSVFCLQEHLLSEFVLNTVTLLGISHKMLLVYAYN